MFFYLRNLHNLREAFFPQIAEFADPVRKAKMNQHFIDLSEFDLVLIRTVSLYFKH
jgi:hypothetical protein